MPLEGQYKATTVDGNDFVEKFSVESAHKIVENWQLDGSKPILCDVDHSSVETSNTQAAGWLTSIWVDEEAKRLKGMLQVSESGAELLNGLEYRYLSPVLLFTEDNYPYYLDSVALTNTPRLQELKPVYNSKDKDETKITVVNTDETNSSPEKTKEEIEETENEDRIVNINEDTPNNPEEKNMDEIRIILGLSEEATEEDIKAAIKEMVDKLKVIADEEISVEAEEAVNECGVDEEKKEEVINCYKQNPALVKSVLNAFKKTPVKMVANAEEAQKPELTENEKLKREYASLKGGKDKVDFLVAHPGMKL